MPRRASPRTACIALAALAACSTSSEPEPRAMASAAATVTAPPAPVRLAPGVVAEQLGIRGAVRVEEREGMLLLTIDGAVQGAVPRSALAERPSGDPLVELLRTTGRTGRALVLGLGTGRTATELGQTFDVLAVDQESAVIDLARGHFRFIGRAEISDAATYLDRATSQKTPFDVVLIETFEINQAPSASVLGPAIKYVDALGGGRGAQGPILALRLWGRPSDAWVRETKRKLRSELGYVELFGAGIGDEPQALYLLASSRPENLVPAPSLPPLAATRAPVDVLESAATMRATGAAPVAEARFTEAPIRERSVRITGYLVRATEDEGLVLDLPHWEMGAVRYRLRGALARDLERLVPKGTKFPTSGDIRSDGDTKATLQSLLDGGGSKRSDVRFSPVALTLEGKARVVAVVDADASMSVPAQARGTEPTHPGLPYGGVLYDLEITSLLGQTSEREWSALARRAMDPRALAAIRAGELDKAAGPLAKLTAELDAHLGPISKSAHERIVAGRLADATRAEAALDPKTPFERAVACDRALVTAAVMKYHEGPLVRALDQALFACAERNYAGAIGGLADATNVAARRLLGLLTARTFTGDDDGSLERRIDALKARIPGLTELEEPPRSDGSPAPPTSP